MDPFSQMKREYNTILDDADSANRNNFAHLKALHDALRAAFIVSTFNYVYIHFYTNP